MNKKRKGGQTKTKSSRGSAPVCSRLKQRPPTLTTNADIAMATPTSISSTIEKNKSTPSSTESVTTTKKKTPAKEPVRQKSSDKKAAESSYTT